jgi:hypothetical protein
MKDTTIALAALFCAALLAVPAFSQEGQPNLDLTKNLDNIKLGGHLPRRTVDKKLQLADGVQAAGPAGAAGAAVPGPSVPTFSNVFVDNTGTVWPVTMVGADPSIAGSGETDVPVVIIPLRLNFASTGDSIGPSDTACVDAIPVLNRVVNSPLFTNVTWIEGGINVGVTQFTDGFQRANFWNYVTTINPGYSVRLAPIAVTPEAILNVPANQGTDTTGVCGGHPIGGVNISYIDAAVRTLISNLNIPPTTFTLVVTYNAVELLGGGGLFVGYHTAVSNPNGTWTYAVGSYTDPTILGLAVNDITVLSHELGEWMDDPFGNNMVPQWGNVGQVQGCQNTLEVGDPLSGRNSIVFMADGTTYMVQDLAFLVWFARQNPSLAVNGWYTTRAIYAGPSKPCPPGGTN